MWLVKKNTEGFNYIYNALFLKSVCGYSGLSFILLLLFVCLNYLVNKIRYSKCIRILHTIPFSYTF